MPKEDGGALAYPDPEAPSCEIIHFHDGTTANLDFPTREVLDAINTAHAAAVAEAVKEAYERCRQLAYDVADGKIHPPPEDTVEAYKLGHSGAANSIGDAIRALSKGGGE